MNAKRKMFLYKNHQHGGMLMELMLSVAISAVLIPFIFNYQKNTIERARNIAVVKQMEIVQNALEKCIESNRAELMKPASTNYIYTEGSECLMLTDGTGQHGLIKYGLNESFVNDYKDDYVLRILLKKKSANSNTGVLQGVVLLQQDGITAMRTREIVDVGGGKLGYTNANTVYGGFDSFETQSSNLGLTNMNGVVGITSAIRRATNNQYLWRLPTDAAADSTMLSDLDIGGNDIENIGTLTGQDIYFDSYIGAMIESRNLTFEKNVNKSLSDSNIGGDSRLSAVMKPNDDTTCSLEGYGDASLTVSTQSNFKNLYCKEYTTNNLTVKDTAIVNKFGVTNTTEKTSFKSSDGDRSIHGIQKPTDKETNVVVSGNLSLPGLAVSKCFAPVDVKDEDHYYNVASNGCGRGDDLKASFNNIKIKKLGEVMRKVYQQEAQNTNANIDNKVWALIGESNISGSLAETYLINMIGVNDIRKETAWTEKTIYDYIGVLQQIQNDIQKLLITWLQTYDSN